VITLENCVLAMLQTVRQCRGNAQINDIKLYYIILMYNIRKYARGCR